MAKSNASGVGKTWAKLSFANRVYIVGFLLLLIAMAVSIPFVIGGEQLGDLRSRAANEGVRSTELPGTRRFMTAACPYVETYVEENGLPTDAEGYTEFKDYLKESSKEIGSGFWNNAKYYSGERLATMARKECEVQ